MIINNINNCDAKNFRAAIVSREISKSLDPTAVHTKKDRELIKSRKDLRAAVESEGQNKIIKEIAREGKKFDIMAGIAEVYDQYAYLAEDKLWEEYNKKYKGNKSPNLITDVRLLYGSMLHMYKQLFKTQKFYHEHGIDSERSMEDSEGKSSSVMTTVGTVDTSIPLVRESDSSVRMNYKIYLDFLANVVIGLKSNESTSFQRLVPEVLGYLWFKDTMDYYSNGGGSNYKYFNKYAKDNNGRSLDLDVINNVFLEGLTKKNIPLTVKDAILKTYMEYSEELGDTDTTISTNIYVFARYIFKILKLNKVDIFKTMEKEIGEGFNPSSSDIKNLMFNPEFEFSFINQIPMYKFEPSFYKQTNTLEDWFRLDKEDLDNEYGIALYEGFNSAEPVKQLLSSTITKGITLNSSQIEGSEYKELTVIEKENELREILMLMHLHKLHGVTQNPNNLFKSLVESKKERVWRMEGPVNIGYFSSKDSNKFFISIKYEEIIKEDRSDAEVGGYSPMYSILGNNKMNVHLGHKFNLPPGTTTPTLKTKEMIESMLDEKAKSQAEKYKSHYEKEDWNIPLRYIPLETLTKNIRTSVRIDEVTKFVHMLGDMVTIKIRRETEGYEDRIRYEEVYLLNNHNVLFKDTIYTPEVKIDKKTNEPYVMFIA